MTTARRVNPAIDGPPVRIPGLVHIDEGVQPVAGAPQLAAYRDTFIAPARCGRHELVTYCLTDVALVRLAPRPGRFRWESAEPWRLLLAEELALHICGQQPAASGVRARRVTRGPAQPWGAPVPRWMRAWRWLTWWCWRRWA